MENRDREMETGGNVGTNCQVQMHGQANTSISAFTRREIDTKRVLKTRGFVTMEGQDKLDKIRGLQKFYFIGEEKKVNDQMRQFMLKTY